MKTKLFILFVVAALLMSSCVTEKKRLRICQSCTLNQSTKDSTGKPKIKETPFDTAAYIDKRRGKNIVLTNNCDSLMKLLAANGNSITTTENGIRTTLAIEGGKIVAKCETDSLKAVIKLLRKEIETDHYREVIKEVPARCAREHLSKWDSFFIITGRILWGLLLVSILVWIIRKRFLP